MNKDMVELALDHFDVEFEEHYQEVNGEEVAREIYMNTYDRGTGLLVMAIPLHRKASHAEIAQAADTFLGKRSEYLTSKSLA